MSSDSKLLQIPFDQYSRQSLAKEIIDSVREPGESFTILDVGGYKGVTEDFHKQDKVTVLDVFDVKEKNYIQGDATDLSFKDRSYDFVVSFDVLEHIPKEKRKKFMKECIRVAKKGVIAAYPIKTKENEAAEKELNSMYRKLHGKDHPWLEEHIEYGLPEKYLAEKELESSNLLTVTFSSNYLPLWLLMQNTIFGASKFEVYGKKIGKLYQFYNSELDYDGTEKLADNYRVVCVGVSSKKDQEQIKRFENKLINNVDEKENVIKVINEISKVMILGTDELYELYDKELNENGKLVNEVKRLEEIIKNLRLVEKDYITIQNSKLYKLTKKINDSRSVFK